MRSSGKQGSWQQQCLVLFLCALCVASYAQALRIFPTYDDGIDYTVKRELQPTRDCKICLATLDLDSCTRCRNSKLIPYYTAKRGYFRARSHSASSNMCGCCAITRLSNNYCCNICYASKRGG